MRLYLLIFFLNFNNMLFSSAEEMNEAEKEGRNFGNQQIKESLEVIQHLSPEDLLPPDSNMLDLNITDLEQKVSTENITNSSIMEMIGSKEARNNSFSDKEGFVSTSDDISNGTNHEILSSSKSLGSDLNETYIKCNESSAPYFIKFERELKVNVRYIPAKEKKTKKCSGHTKIHSGKQRKEISHKLLQDKSEIKTYSLENRTKLFSYEAKETYSHIDNATSCDNFIITRDQKEKERWEEMQDTWISKSLDKLALTQTPACSFISSHCLDTTNEKMIEGKNVRRSCWKEKALYKCFHPSIKECEHINNTYSQLIDKKCIKNTPYGCALWELTFKVKKKPIAITLNTDKFEPYTISKTETSTKDTTDSKFNEIISKLFVFEEIKKDLEDSSQSAEKALLFKGDCFKCSKNILDKILYDCCFKMKGLATKALLAKCNAEEIALAKRREKGLCHYIGAYKEQFLDVFWKSREIHTYCCFPSKLARVMQEQARKQLNKDWGEAKEPKCKGMTVSEITKLDFGKIDLTEIYEDIAKKIPINLENKLQKFQEKIQTRVEKEGA